MNGLPVGAFFHSTLLTTLGPSTTTHVSVTPSCSFNTTFNRYPYCTSASNEEGNAIDEASRPIKHNTLMVGRILTVDGVFRLYGFPRSTAFTRFYGLVVAKGNRWLVTAQFWSAVWSGLFVIDADD